MKKNKLPLLLILSLLFTGCNNSVSEDNPSSPEPAVTLTNGDSETPAIPSSVLDHMARAVSVDGFSVTEDMLTASRINDGNLTRLRDVMKRAAAGEDITIAYIGGSITDGDSASPKNTSCYAYLTTDWWINTFPDANIRYVNAGIGATDSYLGAHRVQDQVLAKDPDLVVVEFAVNDGDILNRETYESLLLHILEYDTSPAVVALMLTTEGGWDYSDVHSPVAFHYGVPIISYQAVLSKGLVTWDQVGSQDGVHPANGGHALIAHLLTAFYRDVLEDINTSTSEEYNIPSSTLTKCRYRNADILFAEDITPTENTGYDPMDVSWIFPGHTGWCADFSEEEASITFEVEAVAIGINYLLTNTDSWMGGNMEVYVDGEYSCTIDSYDPSTWANHLVYRECYRSQDGSSSRHTITILPAEESEGNLFFILGLDVAYE